MSNNTANKVWQRLQLQDSLFSDQKVADSSTVSSATMAKALKPFEKFFATLQSEMKAIKQQNATLFDEVTTLRSSMRKVVSKTLLDKDEWEKIRNALKKHWANDKYMNVGKITEIIAEALALDPDNEENQAVFKVAVDKSKEYLRCTLYKTFVDNTAIAVNEYFKENPTIEEADISDHVDRILRIGQWTKTNPTPEDKKLAKTVIKELILDRMKNPLDEPPRKKRKVDRTYPRSAPADSDNDEDETADKLSVAED